MKTDFVIGFVVLFAGMAGACSGGGHGGFGGFGGGDGGSGGVDGGSGDGGLGATDMAVKLFKLQSGDYKITAVRVGNDGCMVDPNNAMNPSVGRTLPLVNDGMGNIGLGAVTGTPPQPSNGASCPGSPANAACATAPNAKPFNNNVGTLVRDNTVDDGAGCVFHRHVENLVTVTADNQFTAAYTRSDTQHGGGCMTNADCTTTWSWDLSKQ